MANNIGVTKYLSTPIIGLLPFILYLALHGLNVGDEYALIFSLAISLIGEVCMRKFLKSRIFSLSFYISSIALGMTFLFFFVVRDYLQRATIYPIFCEICLVCLLIVVRISQTYITTIYLRKKDLLLKAYFSEFYHVAGILQYALTIQLFLLLIYGQFVSSFDSSKFIEFFLAVWTPVLIVFIIGIYQIYRMRIVYSNLRSEEWLPIVTEDGAVTGKISKKVSFNMKNKFLHPVVRVALTCKGKVFLQERPSSSIVSPDKLDYPFEKYLLFEHEINLGARNSIKRMVGEVVSDVPLRFILKYVFDNENTKRLIFLYVLELESEDLIQRTNKMTGKFWSVRQIEESFVDNVFGENFELEFEYMKNMVLEPSENTNP